VITGLSAITALARTLVERLIAQIVPMVQKLSALIIMGAACYLAWYWLLGPGLGVS
jgi:multisubunit Na+/H+ antiporter MnhB subunit